MNSSISVAATRQTASGTTSHLACRGEQNPLNAVLPLSLQPGNLHVGCWALAHVLPQYGWTVPFFSTNFGRFPQVYRQIGIILSRRAHRMHRVAHLTNFLTRK